MVNRLLLNNVSFNVVFGACFPNLHSTLLSLLFDLNLSPYGTRSANYWLTDPLTLDPPALCSLFVSPT